MLYLHFFIFPGKRMNEELMQKATPGAVEIVSETRWSNLKLFQDFLTNHFVNFIPGNGQHVMLLLDRHKSNVDISLIECAKSHNLIL